jgi:hypothetical protein
MSAGVGQARLRDAVKQLKARWARAREHWDDAAAEAFEREFIEPLDARVLATINAMAKFGEALASAKRECDQ